MPVDAVWRETEIVQAPAAETLLRIAQAFVVARPRKMPVDAVWRETEIAQAPATETQWKTAVVCVTARRL